MLGIFCVGALIGLVLVVIGAAVWMGAHRNDLVIVDDKGNVRVVKK